GSSIPGPVNNNASKEVKDRRPSFQISNTHTFTPQLVSETRVGYQRVRYAQWSDPEAYDDWRTKLGMPAIHADKKLQYGFPNINITGMTAWATPYDKFDFWQDSWNVNGTISLTQGKHLVKFGMSYFHLATVDRIPNFPAGGYYFNGQYTSLPGQANTGAPFADFLLGMSYLSYAGKVGDGMRPITHEWGFFIQDDFRIRPNLTLNLGLRYDMATPIKSTNNSIWTYEPSRNVTVPTDDPYPTDWNNLGPRVGLAWEVTPTLVLRTGYGISYFPQFKGLQGFAVFPPALEQHAYNSSNNPIQPARTFRDDFGTWLDLGNAKEFPLAVNNTVGMYITDNMDSPYMQSWNLTLEHQLGQSMVISASYVGNKGTHLESRVDLNQLPASLLGPNENFGGKTPQERKLYPGVNRVTALQNDSNSNYHALQMKFERRMAKGLTFLWSFTHSKAIDTFYSQIQDGWNRRGSRGVANWDVPNALVGSGLYEIPFLQDQRSIWGQIFGGWQANWVLTFRDGFPFSPSTNTNLSGGFLGSERRPDRIGSGVLPESQRTLDRWFDPTAFKSPEPYTYGNAGSNILRGPGFSNLDMSFFKKFRIHEGKTLEFRTNFSNFTNTPCFALPARVIEASNAGVINATSKGSRSVQFGLKFVF
ncbi:MAG TPA: TonB-dependent receptor, partial [Acidobacteriota bacterium]|nr:TonB-dependent receptor [Acidobacteriota bacterium]